MRNQHTASRACSNYSLGLNDECEEEECELAGLVVSEAGAIGAVTEPPARSSMPCAAAVSPPWWFVRSALMHSVVRYCRRDVDAPWFRSMAAA